MGDNRCICKSWYHTGRSDLFIIHRNDMNLHHHLHLWSKGRRKTRHQDIEVTSTLYFANRQLWICIQYWNIASSLFTAQPSKQFSYIRLSSIHSYHQSFSFTSSTHPRNRPSSFVTTWFAFERTEPFIRLLSSILNLVILNLYPVFVFILLPSL